MEQHYHIDGLIFLVRPRTTDISIIQEVITKDIYKATDQIESGDVVIDIGAHIGSFAVYAASLGAKVLAYEPARVNFDLLLRNIELNGYDVEANELGIMDPPGPKILHIRQGNLGGCSFYTDGDPREEVKTITLKEVFDTHPIAGCNFLKIDCEGAEYDILRDFPYFNKVHRIALEYVGDPMRTKIVELLEQNGFKVTYRANERMGTIYARRPTDEDSV